MCSSNSGEDTAAAWLRSDCATPKLPPTARKPAPDACRPPTTSSNAAPNRSSNRWFRSSWRRPPARCVPTWPNGALRMMRKMSPEDVAQVQRGMAARPDSIATLKTINVPTMLVTGDEDTMTGVNEAELMRQHIANSELFVIPKAGHYSPWEQPADAAKILRVFLDGLR